MELVEETHPIFIVDGWLPDNYEDIREEFLAYAQNPNITRLDFAFAAVRFKTTLRDGHMSGWGAFWDDDSFVHPAIFGGLLDVLWAEKNGELFLRDENGSMTEYRVIEIGGVPVQQVFAVVDRYHYGENEVARVANYITFSRFGDIIQRAGGVINGASVILTLSNNGIPSAMEAAILSVEEIISDAESDDADSCPDFIIRHEWIGDDIFS